MKYLEPRPQICLIRAEFFLPHSEELFPLFVKLLFSLQRLLHLVSLSAPLLKGR